MKPIRDYQILGTLFNDLSIMVASGSLMEDVFYVLSNETSDDNVREVLRDLGTRLEDGASLDEAMRENACFPSYACNMLSAGESGGRLEEVTAALSEYYEHQRLTQEKLLTSLVQPMLLLGILALVMGAFIGFALPILKGVYKSLGGDASGYVHVAYILGGIGLGVLLLAFLLLLFLLICYKTGCCNRLLKLFWHKSLLTKNASYCMSQAQAFSEIETRMAGGVPAELAFEKTTENVDHIELKKNLVAATERIVKGEPLSEALIEENVLPKVCAHIIYSGAKRGDTEKSLGKVRDLLFEEAMGECDRLVNLAEPVITGFFTIMIAAALLTVILPLISVMSAIG